MNDLVSFNNGQKVSARVMVSEIMQHEISRMIDEMQTELEKTIICLNKEEFFQDQICISWSFMMESETADSFVFIAIS